MAGMSAFWTGCRRSLGLRLQTGILEDKSNRETPIVLALMIQRRRLQGSVVAEDLNAAVTEEYRHPIHLHEPQLGVLAKSKVDAAACRCREIVGADTEG